MSHNQYSIYSAVLGGANLRHVEDVNLDPAVEQSIVNAGGSLFPLNLFVAKQESKFKIKSHDLSALITTLAISLSAGKALGTASASYFQYRKRAEAGYATGSTAFRLKSFNGFVHFDSIEATQDDKKLATADLTMYCLADSSGNYLTAENNQALVSSPAMTDYGFVLGPLYMDVSSVATLIEGNNKFRYDSGNVYEGSRDAGAIVAKQGALKAIEPKISFSVKHLVDLLTFGTSLAAVTNVTQYLQAVDADGRRVAPATTSHMSISFPTAKLEPNKVSGGNDKNDASLDYVAHLIGETMTVSMGVALPS